MNNNSESFSISARLRSGVHASEGIVEVIRSQHNAWLHALATVCVLAAGYACDVSISQWCFLIMAVTAVWVVETLNTAFELLCDVVSPEFHPLVKKSKDMAAGAVLLTAIGAATIGFVIFIPYVMAYL
ncbi:MAG: diacylglycerol kinase family protein [Halioglobus sp.]|nr:diacylglycerol kinase family protein [Halioglobus sp.]